LSHHRKRVSHATATKKWVVHEATAKSAAQPTSHHHVHHPTVLAHEGILVMETSTVPAAVAAATTEAM
jgi:hypothetical protein